MASIALECHGLTDRGRVREVNEDQFLIADLAKSMKVLQTSLPQGDHIRLFGHHHGTLLLVADGMGGQAGGQKASGLAVKTVADYVLNMMPWFLSVQDGEKEIEAELKTVLEECQRKVFAASDGATGRKRMGTTLTMACILWPRIYIVHAGDSRCYLRRGDHIHQATKDHTIAQQMLERGLITAEEAERSRWSHILYNCIGGGSEEIRPDVYKATLQEGDELLLCTDGVSKYISDDKIASILKHSNSSESAVHNLIAAANEAGGNDNITAIVARAHGPRSPLEETKEHEKV